MKEDKYWSHILPQGNESLLRLAIESSSIGVWELNLSTHEIYRNIFHDMAFGYSELQSMWTLDIFKSHIHPDDSHHVMSMIEEAMEGKRNCEAEFRVVWIDESIHWLSIAAKLDTNLQKRTFIGTIVDITEKKRSHEAMQEALFYRDEFLSIASHELKTPLTSIKLQSQLFKRMVEREDPSAYEPERLNRLMDQTDRHVTRLVKLVDDMLDISRIRTGKLAISKEKVDCAELVKEVVERIKSQVWNPEMEGIFIERLDPSFCFCDKQRIEQVLNNLLNNAIRYGRGRSVRVFLKSLENSIEISVKDEGDGISQRDQEKIFTRFQRAIPASEVSGLGLGLYIAKQIVESHHGSIKVESIMGSGSTFSFSIPTIGIA